MKGFSAIAFARGLGGVVVLLVVWEGFARSGMYSTAMTPPIESVARTAWRMLADGSLVENALATLLRVFVGLAISFAIAVPLGVLMARYWVAERIFQPVLSVLLPIPSLAWVPLFVLWFGIGNIATILVVIYAAFFPMIYSVWTGVRAVNPLWLRAATVMGADEAMLFRKVIWPGSLPYVINGLRLSFGRAWIGVIGGELLAKSAAWPRRDHLQCQGIPRGRGYALDAGRYRRYRRVVRALRVSGDRVGDCAALGNGFGNKRLAVAKLNRPWRCVHACPLPWRTHSTQD